MNRTPLPQDARIGRVRLRVADLDRALRFYGQVLGLEALPGDEGGLQLSPTGKPPALLVLVEDRDAPVRPRRTAGLFHFALLVPERRDLGQAFLHIRDEGWSFQGFADHSVSESLYLTDPEGNGIEIYADRPRSEWSFDGDEVHITTDSLDLASLIEAAGPPQPWRSLAHGTVVGHVHLEVQGLDRSERFYHEAIGFDPTLRSYPGARFLSAGGYHHHLAVNAWNHPRSSMPARAAGLVDFEIVVPGADAREALRGRLVAAGVEVETDRGAAGFRVEDPDRIGIVVTA